MSDLPVIGSIKIIEDKHLPFGTIVVSPDIAAFLREKYSASGQDQDFLRRLGIADVPAPQSPP